MLLGAGWILCIKVSMHACMHVLAVLPLVALLQQQVTSTLHYTTGVAGSVTGTCLAQSGRYPLTSCSVCSELCDAGYLSCFPALVLRCRQAHVQVRQVQVGAARPVKLSVQCTCVSQVACCLHRDIMINHRPQMIL